MNIDNIFNPLGDFKSLQIHIWVTIYVHGAVRTTNQVRILVITVILQSMTGFCALHRKNLESIAVCNWFQIFLLLQEHDRAKRFFVHSQDINEVIY